MRLIRHRHALQSRLLVLLALVAILASTAPAAAAVPATPAAAAPAQAERPVRPSINYYNRVIMLPLIRNVAPAPPPPALVSADLFLRPVPLERVQRGQELSVEYRYTNTGGTTTAAAPFSLFYPERLIFFENALTASGDTLVGYDATRVIIQLNNVAPGETRTGRVSFFVRREAGEGERIGLYGTYDCQQVGVPCRSNFAEVEVIRNDDEGGTGSGGTFAMTVSPDRGPPGTAHTFRGSFFSPGEEVVTWMNTATGTYPLPVTTTADGNGNITIVYGTGGLVPGYYSLVAHGRRSNTEGVGAFIVTGPGNLLAGPAWDAALSGGVALGGGVAVPGTWLPATEPRPAQLSGAGGVAGRVADGAGVGVAGAPIEVRDSLGSLVATATSRADGVYFVPTGLLSGSYRVTAAPSRRGGQAAYQFYANVTVTDVQVTDPEITRGVNLTLPAAGGVRGTLTAGGSPLVGVRVLAQTAAGVAEGAAVSGADGSYLITNLSPGDYTLRFDPRGATGGGSLGVTRLDITVRANEIVTAAAALRASPTAGEISGRVTDAASGAGIADVVVLFADPATGAVAVASTDAEGAYHSGPIAPGAYKVQFLPGFSELPGTAGYVGEFYDDAATFAASASVTVTAGQVTSNISAGLAQGGSISGRVTGDGQGLAAVFVVAFGPDGLPAGSALSDGTGAYTVRGLRPASYTLRFITSASPDPTTRAFQSTFYDATPPADPTPVAVAASQAVAGIDQALGRGVQIVGTITAEDTGAGLAGVYVLAYDGVTGAPAAVALTDAEGRYATPGLARGGYKVRFSTIFSPNRVARTYIDEFFSNAPDLGSARTVIVADPGPRVLNAELARGGSISGRVSAEDTGVGLAGVVVVARSGTAIVGVVSTDAGGAYTIPGLEGGAYTVEFITDLSPNPLVRRYAGELYNNVVPGGAGTPVTVTVEQDTAGIDATLSPGG